MVEMREDNQSRIQYNRILLPNQLPFPRILKTSTATILTFDGSGLQFLIEEFISLGVIDIAVDPRSETARVIDTLPEILNKRLIIFSKVNRSIEKCDAIFAPLSEELNVKFHWPAGFWPYEIYHKFPVKFAHAIIDLQWSLYEFLIALDSKSQVDVNINKFKSSISIVNNFIRNPHARANLAILLGILNTYESLNINSVELRSTAPERLITIFQEFVEDETYKLLSTHAHYLGFPNYVRRSVIMLKRLAKRLITKAAFKPVTNFGSKVISTATQIPLPDAELGSSLIKGGFLPPIVPLDAAIRRARKAWRSFNPDFIPIDKDLPSDVEVMDVQTDDESDWL